MYGKVYFLNFLNLFLTLSIPEKMVHARQYSVGKRRLFKKLIPLERPVLEDYVTEFLDKNPAAKEHLIVATEKLLLQWSKDLAKKIEERYSILAPSTLVNRMKYHRFQIFDVLKERQDQDKKKLIAEPIDVTHNLNQSYYLSTIKSLLSQKENHQKELAEHAESIAQRMKNLIETDDLEKSTIKTLLNGLIQKLHGHHQSMMMSFVGLPAASIRKKLDQKWRILAQESHTSIEHLSDLLEHSQVLQNINQSMCEQLAFIFSDAHLGITPYADHAMGLQCEMIHKAIREMASIRFGLSKENQILFDHLCRLLAVGLWVDWIPAFKKEPLPSMASAPLIPGVPPSSSPNPMATEPCAVQISAQMEPWPDKPSDEKNSAFLPEYSAALATQKELLTLLSRPLDTQILLEKLLSPVRSGLILSKVALGQGSKKILDVLSMVQNGFENPQFVKALIQILPSLLEKISNQGKSWEKEVSGKATRPQDSVPLSCPIPLPPAPPSPRLAPEASAVPGIDPREMGIGKKEGQVL